ncbi:hypothetical protein [Streptomyces flavofungini]|uniref:Secreted protein n=1 Tax=Streptomyces flavofungini TaxID=68200 RepID=A0ABS0X9E8_9ACTN|nr:hypothetical protein [Streptomyces flavofungini]MBJ3809831.1 hypothetical protein [Streptomyces flavofungini]GHC81037.1 hypothetical protein GCM10010349_63920 [Streptomyces flavofungini]
MDINGAGAPIVAVVGVVGTLLSALLTQRAAERSRQREQERAEQTQAWAREAMERRACCIALNTAARQYLAALTDQLHALIRAEDPRAARQRLTEARDLHRDVYAEAQLRLPDPVLSLAGELTHALGSLYGRLRRLDDGIPQPGDSLDAAQAEIDALWERLRELRSGMRADLGASGLARPGPSALEPHRPHTGPGASRASSGR